MVPGVHKCPWFWAQHFHAVQIDYAGCVPLLDQGQDYCYTALALNRVSRSKQAQGNNGFLQSGIIPAWAAWQFDFYTVKSLKS